MQRLSRFAKILSLVSVPSAAAAYSVVKSKYKNDKESLVERTIMRLVIHPIKFARDDHDNLVDEFKKMTDEQKHAYLDKMVNVSVLLIHYDNTQKIKFEKWKNFMIDILPKKSGLENINPNNLPLIFADDQEFFASRDAKDYIPFFEFLFEHGYGKNYSFELINLMINLKKCKTLENYDNFLTSMVPKITNIIIKKKPLPTGIEYF